MAVEKAALMDAKMVVVSVDSKVEMWAVLTDAGRDGKMVVMMVDVMVEK